MLVGKNPSANAGEVRDAGSFPGWGRWLNGYEFEQALGVDDGQGSLMCCSHGVAKSWAWLSDWTELGRSPGGGMATHSSILAWRIPWTEEPGGLLSTGSQRVRHDWSDVARTRMKTELELFICFRQVESPWTNYNSFIKIKIFLSCTSKSHLVHFNSTCSNFSLNSQNELERFCIVRHLLLLLLLLSLCSLVRLCVTP